MTTPLTIVLKGAQLTCEKRPHEDSQGFHRLHRVLRLLMDSPLSKAHKLQVYVHTQKNVLVKLSHLLEIPEDPAQLNEVMAHLLKRLVVKSGDGTVLAKVVKNPVASHLPPNSTRVRLSPAGCRVLPRDLEPSLERGFVFFVSVGGSEKEEVEVCMKISDFRLSPEACCAKLTSMFEELTGIF